MGAKHTEPRKCGIRFRGRTTPWQFKGEAINVNSVRMACKTYAATPHDRLGCNRGLPRRKVSRRRRTGYATISHFRRAA